LHLSMIPKLANRILVQEISHSAVSTL